MPAAPVIVLLIKVLTGDSFIEDNLVLWVEWVGIWAFSIYWILKSIELFRSGPPSETRKILPTSSADGYEARLLERTGKKSL